MTLAVLNIVFLALSPVLFKFSSYMQERATHWSSEDRIRRFWIDFAIAAAEIVLVGVIWMAFHRLSVGSAFIGGTIALSLGMALVALKLLQQIGKLQGKP